MPNFQGAVNQVLGMAGAFKKIDEVKPSTPEEIAEANKQQELESLGRKSEVLKQAAEVAGKGVQADVDGTVANLTSKDIAKEQTEVARRQFELDPTQERYQTYSKLRSASYDVPLARFPADEEAQDIAASRVESQVRAKQKQKDSMRKHIEGLPISLGGKVKDLDPTLKEQIIAKYMEANDGKQE